MTQQHRGNGDKSLLVLGTIWLLGAISDRLWFAFDRSVPAWDQAEYLTGTLNYWLVLQHPQWLSGEWWTNFWLLSTKIPPLIFIATVPFLRVFGTAPDEATLVFLLFSAILLASVYSLGVQLFNRQVGLWAAAICVVLPGLYRFRLQFLLDYPLTAAITLTFFCLTMWKKSEGSSATDYVTDLTDLTDVTDAWKTEVGRGKKSQGRHDTDVDADRRINSRKQGQVWSLSLSSYFWAIAFGISLGLSILVKHTTVLFLFTPIVWLAVGTVRQKAWGRLAQLAGALLLSVAVFGPWAKTNWLLILTGGKRATFDSAIAEGDPALNTINAWIYYGQHLPEQVSWPLLLIPLVGLLIYYWRNRQDSLSKLHFNSCRWLAVFWGGAYLINSLNLNKDDRYVVPYLPVVAIFLAYCLTLWPRKWGQQIRWGTIGLAIVAMLFHMWPLGGALGDNLVQIVSPGNSSYPYLGKEWPHREVIAEIIDTEPYLQSTLGVLPSTPEINQHNLNYYGALANFQVYGRQVGTSLKEVPQDVRSLSWFVTKTGPQGSIREGIKKAQNAAVAAIEKGDKFQLQKSWILPDNTNLNLYRKRWRAVEIQPLNEVRSQVQLEQVTVAASSVPGVPIPVTYIWSGPWQQLQSGLVVLTWKNRLGSDIQTGQTYRILHDRAIAQATLHPGILEADKFAVGFRVVDRTAMLPPANIAPGSYNLEATYLNRKTGETYPINVAAVSVKIEAQPLNLRSQTLPGNENDKKFKIKAKPLDLPSKALPRNEDNANIPELDLVTQLRVMAANLPKGLPGLEPVFEQIGRINQYDPIQDYTIQAEQAFEYRLKQEPNNLELAYGLAFSRALQQNVKGAIAALEKVTQLDSKNPYAYAYLAFVNLYGWHPKAAETALKPALALNPNLPEIRVLNGVAALLQGNLIQAWQDLQYLKKIKI
ncbi:MAG TPA: phospholipid carrier-dependent glycosyltransferase [Microcoleaceae bacterium UBA10368]|jgi:4-amino-4-deoxy-L-arabinose transferase and related glycosyltransferases of PMT family|nr:phospholipid carrier-dependent glycosyltransferase [Microcoleaceae cyanobacterium UBA10368]HCV30963.1 phospholipid carrier-dependent glycosyltransferase [Microcoleaceae cyanobacterium UBA9251]